MKQMDTTLYLKISQNILVQERRVTLEDIASISCTDQTIANQLKKKQIYVFEDSGKKQKQIFSVLKIIELIHQEYPFLTISNEGEKDFIIEYGKNPKYDTVISGIKTILVSIVIFFGAAFTIMSFNNDISINELFQTFYFQVMGVPSNGMTELEVFYCIGLAVGITVFFNHAGKQKMSKDPTPIQVQMRKYEQDVNTTYIENAERREREEDVE